jgi:hypothetical protein
LSFAVILTINVLVTPGQKYKSCLPSDVRASDVVSAQLLKPTLAVKKTTVAQRLAELKAHCKKGKLVDASGKEIHFFRMTGCWGNPPQDYLEILEQQNKELEKLRKRYTVIEMTCNPEGV